MFEKSINALEAAKRIAARHDSIEYLRDYDESISVLKDCRDDCK